jgi:phosphopantetheinyl transferase
MPVSLPSERHRARPCPTPGVIDVWRVDLASVGNQLEELLCAEEQARAERIVRERNRRLWIRSRGILRTVLGRYLDSDPRALRFELGPHGKPALHGGAGQASDLRFNLSHSGEVALIAVTAGREVGVDIECARPRYTAELLRAWTQREAVVKCLGTGLATPRGDSPATDLWTTELEVGPHAAAALATQDEPSELRCWEWDGRPSQRCSLPVRVACAALAAKAP